MCWWSRSLLSSSPSEFPGREGIKSDDPDFNYFDIKWCHYWWSTSPTNACGGQGYVHYDEETIRHTTFLFRWIEERVLSLKCNHPAAGCKQKQLNNRVTMTVARRHMTEGLWKFELCPTSAVVPISLWAALIFPTLLLIKHSWSS